MQLQQEEDDGTIAIKEEDDNATRRRRGRQREPSRQVFTGPQRAWNDGWAAKAQWLRNPKIQQ